MRHFPTFAVVGFLIAGTACGAAKHAPAPAPAPPEGPIVDPSVVDALARARADGTRLAPFAEVRGLRLPDAYAVQAALTERLVAGGDRVVGYKAAFNGPEALARYGLDAPAWAPLFESMRLPDGGALAPRGEGTLLAEVEVAFTVGQRIAEPVADLAELRARIASVHAAIELPRVRFDAPPTGLDLIADGAAAHRFVLGPASPAEALREEALAASLHLGDAALVEAVGGAPWQGLLEVVRAVADAGGALDPGDVVLSGVLGSPVPLPAIEDPVVLRGEVRGIGSVQVELRGTGAGAGTVAGAGAGTGAGAGAGAGARAGTGI